jgi:pimeloyl-ACP methyl ester carboxylesterase
VPSADCDVLPYEKRVFGERQVTPNLSQNSQQSGVVLLHGIARSARSFGKMQGALEAAGFATLNLDYRSRAKSLAALVADIHAPIAAFSAHLDGPISFVAHSMGGLLTRAYLATHLPPRLGRVLLLGPPNNGSEIADRLSRLALYRAFFGPAGQQLTTRPDAATKALLPGPDYPLGIIAGDRSVYPIASRLLPSPNDGRVSVASTKLEGMTDHVVIAAAHPFLVRDQRAIAQTIAFLRDGRFTPTA